MSENSQSLEILGVRVDRVSWPQIEQFCQEALEGERSQQIVTVNGEFILDAQDKPEFKTVINQADLVIPDSTNIVWVSHFKNKQPLTAVTPGSELVERLAALAVKNQASIFLLGAKPGVTETAGRVLQQKYPGLTIAGTSSANPNQGEMAQRIKITRADIVLVAYGAPTQELWINQHKEGTGAKILVGVGGTFDMLAGRLPRAPRWLQQLHLEWLWRLLIQPSRFGRIWRAVIIFPLKVLTSG